MNKFIQRSLGAIVVLTAVALYWSLKNSKPEPKPILPLRAFQPPSEEHTKLATLLSSMTIENISKTPSRQTNKLEKKRVKSTQLVESQSSTTTTYALLVSSATLGARLLSSDPSVSKSAESELPKLSNDEKNQLAVFILKTVKNLNDPSLQYSVASKAGNVLVRLGPSAFPALIKGLDDDVAAIRMKSAYALGELGPFAKEALPPLIRNAEHDKYDFVRCDAIDAVGKMGPLAEGAVPSLMSVIKDPNKMIRFHIVEAIGNIGPKAKQAIPELIKILKEDPDIDTRANAAKSLGQMGSLASAAVPDLIAASKEKEQRLSEFALTALQQIGTPEAVAAIKASKH